MVPDQESYTYPPPTITPAIAALAEEPRALTRIRAQLRRAAAELAALDALLHATEVRLSARPPQALALRAPALTPGVAGGLLQTSVAPAPPGLVEPLTAREREVLARLGQRWSNKEIAAALHVSPETVKRHAATIYAKLGAGGRRAAAQRAAELGLLPRSAAQRTDPGGGTSRD